MCIRDRREAAGFHQAEEITLTVGQAFDLAYKRFLEEGNSVAGADGDTDYKKQCLLLQRRVSM